EAQSRNAVGTLSLAASAVSSFEELDIQVRTAEGALTAALTLAFTQVEFREPTGTLTLSGTATAVEVEVRTAEGGLTLSGVATTAQSAVRTAGGILTLSGEADPVAYGTTVVVTVNATATLSGTAVAQAIQAPLTRAAAGALSLSGLAILEGTEEEEPLTFTPPGEPRSLRHYTDHPLFRRIIGEDPVSLLKLDGTYQQFAVVDPADIARAEAVYLGGRYYLLT